MTLWLLGGHDPTHGAGLFRDLVTAKRVAPALARRFAVTALTQQGRGRPASATAVPLARLRDRIGRWPPPRAIKLGLAPDGLAEPLSGWVAEHRVPVVVDPVLRATDGGALGATPGGLAPLLAVATLITPNRSEACALVGPTAGQLSDSRLADALGARFPSTAVLLKGGYGGEPDRVVDRLVRGGSVVVLDRPRQSGPDPRGTGCALATAIAAGLAQGQGLEPAVRGAVGWLDRARRRVQPGPDGRAHLRDWASTVGC